MDGGIRRRGIKRKKGGVTIGWGFQVMLIPLIYLISGWQGPLFTSDVLARRGVRDENKGEKGGSGIGN